MIREENTVSIPGSKSISHRMIIGAALADGSSLIRQLLSSEDLDHTSTALASMGARIQKLDQNTHEIIGFNGRPCPFNQEIYLGNSGTSMRLLAGIAGLGNSPYTLTGNERMQQRPMGELLSGLIMAGIDAKSLHGNDAPPVVINGSEKKGGQITLDCSKSSQYLSSLLLAGATLEEGLVISLPQPPVSEPYVNLTMDIMKTFNVHVEKISGLEYRVPGGQQYTPGIFVIEPDISNASYFWAAGALSGSMTTVANISKNSLQGDIRLLDILEQMGCQVTYGPADIGVKGGSLTAVDVDMSDIPDVVPTLSVVAAFADGITVIRNIGHLREKECDRIDAVTLNLNKMGIDAKQGPDWISVKGGMPEGAFIETFNDHRIAMAFSIAGIKIPGIEIENPGCVAKSFPSFWEIFDALSPNG